MGFLGTWNSELNSFVGPGRFSIYLLHSLSTNFLCFSTRRKAGDYSVAPNFTFIFKR